MERNSDNDCIGCIELWFVFFLSNRNIISGPAKVGDYYYSDGTWSTEYNTSKQCIGIVFALTDTKGSEINPNLIESMHGRIIALQDVAECQWGNVGEDVIGIPNFTEWFNESPAQLHINEYGCISDWPTGGCVTDFNGYENTQYTDEMEFEVPKKSRETVKRLWKSMGRQRIRLMIVAVSVVFYTVLSVAAPVYSAKIVDLLFKEIKAAIETGDIFRVSWEHVGREIMILLLIYTVTGILYMFQSFLMASFAERLSLELRTKISRKLSRLPLSYYDGHQPGEVLSRATNDLDKMAEVMQTGLLKLFTAVGMVAGSLIMMFYFHVGLTLVFLLFTVLAMLSTSFFSAKTLHCAAKRQQAVSLVTRRVEEAYSGRTVIKAFTQEKNSRKDMEEAVEELARTSRKADFMMNVVNPFIRMVNRLGQAVIAVFAGKLLLDGVLSVGVFQAFFQYVYQASEPLTEAAYMINSLQSSIASVERIFQLLDEEEIRRRYSPQIASRLCGEYRMLRFFGDDIRKIKQRRL